jgi:hypothetical protein
MPELQALQALLDERFTLGQRYANRFAIYVRKTPAASPVESAH